MLAEMRRNIVRTDIIYHCLRWVQYNDDKCPATVTQLQFPRQCTFGSGPLPIIVSLHAALIESHTSLHLA
jgi:hypothetical protein